MGKVRKSAEVEIILKTWDRRGFPEMTKGQRASIYARMIAMPAEELIRISNDKKKPIFIVNIARVLLNKKAFKAQEQIVDRLDGKIINANITKQEEQKSIEEINAEIERLTRLEELCGV